MKWKVLLAVMVVGVAGGSAQMPAGAHNVDDTSRQDAVNAQIAAAEGALEHGDFAGAVEKLKTLAAQRPKDARVLYDLGYAEERMGDADSAAKAYAGAIVASPEMAEPRVALGLLEARAGKVDAAHKDLDAAASLTGASPEVRGRALRAMVVLDQTAHPQQAQAELLEAVKLTGETPEDVAMGAAMAAKAGDAEDAETAYRRALVLKPGDVGASAGLAHTLQQEKKLPEAEAVLTDALKQHDGDPVLVSQLASLYMAEDKAKEAMPLLEQLQAKNPQDVALATMLARVYAMAGELAAAEKMYVGLVAASPKDPVLLDSYGSVLVKEQKYAQAESVLGRAVALRDAFKNDAAWGVAAQHLGFAASKNGHPQVALDALAARSTVLPDTPSVLFLKAISYDALHQRKNATQAYKAFLAAAKGTMPDEEFEAQHRMLTLQRER